MNFSLSGEAWSKKGKSGQDGQAGNDRGFKVQQGRVSQKMESHSMGVQEGKPKASLVMASEKGGIVLLAVERWQTGRCCVTLSTDRYTSFYLPQIEQSKDKTPRSKDNSKATHLNSDKNDSQICLSRALPPSPLKD